MKKIALLVVMMLGIFVAQAQKLKAFTIKELNASILVPADCKIKFDKKYNWYEMENEDYLIYLNVVDDEFEDLAQLLKEDGYPKAKIKEYEGESFSAETVVGFKAGTDDDISTLQFYANVESAYDDKRLAVDISVYDVSDKKADLVTKMLNSIQFYEDDEEFQDYASKSDAQKSSIAMNVANKAASSSSGGLAGVAMAVADEVLSAVPGGKLVKGLLSKFLK